MATAPKPVQKTAAKGKLEAVEPSAAAPAKSKSKLVLILIILLVLMGAGGAAWYFMGKTASDSPTAQAKQPVKAPLFMVIEPFTVNLQPDGAGDQYLQVAFSLQVTDEKDVDAIKLYLPQVRSRLLLLLSSKKASEISTLAGKKALADEIVAQMKQPFAIGASPQKVTNVFFTSFVIQ